MPRFWEHVAETRELKKNEPHAQRRKVQAFSRYPECGWACVVVRQGPVQQGSALEEKLIAELQPNGNTRHRASQPCKPCQKRRHRPPKHLRVKSLDSVSFDLGDAIERRVACQLAKESARLEARERLKAAERGFHCVFSHLLRAHVSAHGCGPIPLSCALRVGAAGDLRSPVNVDTLPWTERQAYACVRFAKRLSEGQLLSERGRPRSKRRISGAVGAPSRARRTGGPCLSVAPSCCKSGEVSLVIPTDSGRSW